MIVSKAHALLLECLLADKQAGRPYTPTDASQEDAITELEVQSLVRLVEPWKIGLTYLGEELARLLHRSILDGGVPKPEEWRNGWRWIGSEVIAMLESARRAGVAGPLSEKLLMTRGFAARTRDEQTKREPVVLTETGQHVLEIYDGLEPDLRIDADLSHFIRKQPRGPAEASLLPTGTHEEHLLEAMRLIAYSVPNSEVYSFTPLGQAVKKAIEMSGGPFDGYVIAQDIINAIDAAVDGGNVPTDMVENLQALGYLTAQQELLPAGEWLLEAARLYRGAPAHDVWTFTVTLEQVELLMTIDEEWLKSRINPKETPTLEHIRAQMIDRKLKQYKKAYEFRGARELQERDEVKEPILERFGQARDLARWYDDNFILSQDLAGLEAFSLVERRRDIDGREVYVLTDFGRLVHNEQRANPREITATAVRAITCTHQKSLSPRLEWYQEARNQGLMGTGEPSESGLMYAALAENLPRRLFLTNDELRVLKKIGTRGENMDQIKKDLAGEDQESMRRALEKLEAYHLIDVLPDGNVIATPAGQKLDRAMSIVPTGVGNAVNPDFYRILKAITDMGQNLWVKGKHIRMMPSNVGEAVMRSGLTEAEFRHGVEGLRVAGLMGRTNVNDAGRDFLEAVEMINPPASLREYHRAVRVT